MRRFSAAGAAIVMCLALGGLPAAAQDVPAATVTVTQECVDLGASPVVCDWTASDPRLTGTLTHDQVGLIGEGILPEPPEAAISWLDGTLDGPEGSWTVRIYLMWTYPMSLLTVLSGTGDNEGWHYIAWSVDEDLTDTVVDWTGMLYEGDVMPFGPLEPTAE